MAMSPRAVRDLTGQQIQQASSSPVLVRLEKDAGAKKVSACEARNLCYSASRTGGYSVLCVGSSGL
jgi:hypothetical protein